MYREINTFSLCGHVEPILRLNPSPEDYEFHILGKGQKIILFDILTI